MLSTQIEGTQATLGDIFEFEGEGDIKNIKDVREVVHYIQAMSDGLKHLETHPIGVRVIHLFFPTLPPTAKPSKGSLVSVEALNARSSLWIPP